MTIIRLLFFLLSLWCLPVVSPVIAQPDLATLIKRVEQQYMGASSSSTVAMTVVTGHWERHLSMESWSLGRDYFLIRILSPAKEKGVATLKADREVWNFLPKVDRVIRIPPSMMGGSWMGSHITNDDLVKANHIDQDYDFTLLKEDPTLWIIEAIPKPDAPVIWGKIIYQIEKKELIPVLIEYFDEDNIMVRKIIFDDVQSIGDRTVPLKMTILPLEKPQEKTVMHYRKLQFDIDLKRDFFSLAQLKRRR